MMAGILIFGILGFIISLYGFIVQQKLKLSDTYVPLCDFSDKISCSAAFTSKYGELIGIPNTHLGLLFFVSVVLFELLGLSLVVFVITGMGFLISLYLAYLLYIKVRSVCVVCTAIYLINLLLFVLSTLNQFF